MDVVGGHWLVYVLLVICFQAFANVEYGFLYVLDKKRAAVGLNDWHFDFKNEEVKIHWYGFLWLH